MKDWQKIIALLVVSAIISALIYYAVVNLIGIVGLGPDIRGGVGLVVAVIVFVIIVLAGLKKIKML